MLRARVSRQALSDIAQAEIRERSAQLLHTEHELERLRQVSCQPHPLPEALRGTVSVPTAGRDGAVWLAQEHGSLSSACEAMRAERADLETWLMTNSLVRDRARAGSTLCARLPVLCMLCTLACRVP
jgi:hypothetical protein